MRIGRLGFGFAVALIVAVSAHAVMGFTDPAALNTNAASDSGGDLQPQVATDGGGNWVAVWTSGDTLGGTIGTDSDILVSRSTSNGATWTAPAPLNTNAASDSGSDGQPQVTTDGAGNWVAVWESTDTLGGTIGTDEDILVSRSTNNGTTWTAPAALNTNAASDSGGDREPQVTTDGLGNWVAVWHSNDTLGGTIGTDYDILVSRSTNNGATWTAPAALNTNAASDSGGDYRPQVTTNGAGNWVVVWDSTDSLGGAVGTDNDILISRSTNNGATWTAPAALNTDAGSDSGFDGNPQVATDGAGDWVAVWRSSDPAEGTLGTDYDILVSRSTNNGAAWTAPAALNTNAASDSGNDLYPQVTTDGAGNWVTVWKSSDTLGGTIGTDGDILAARSTNNGAAWTAPAALNTNAASDSGSDQDPRVTTDGVGNWVVVWRSNDSLGGAIGGEGDILFSISDDVGPPHVASVLRSDASPTIATSVVLLVTFSENVTGVGTGDFALAVTGVAGASVTSVSADTGSTRTVTVDTGTGSGTIRLDVSDDDSITNAAGDKLGGTGIGNGNFTSGETYIIDPTPPVITPPVPNVTTLVNTVAQYDLTQHETDDQDSGAALDWSINTNGATFYSAMIDANDLLTVTPDPGESGEQTATLTLTDTDGLTATQDITISVGVTGPTPPTVVVILPTFPTPATESDDLLAIVSGGTVSAGLTKQFEYEWSNGVDPVTIHGPKTSITDVLLASATAAEETWSVRVRTYDGSTYSSYSNTLSEGPLISLGGSVLGLNAVPAEITLGQLVTLNGSITPVQPGVGVFFDQTVTPLGGTATQPPTIFTNFIGNFQQSFLPDEAGGWSFVAEWQGTATVFGDAATAALYVNKATPSLDISHMSHSSAPVGFEDLVVEVSFDPNFAQSLPGFLAGNSITLQILRESQSQGSLVGTTGADGVAVFDFGALNSDVPTANDFVFDEIGTWEFVATFAEDANFLRATTEASGRNNPNTLEIGDGAGYAVLIAGALDDKFGNLGEGQIEHTKTMDFVYRTLRNRDFRVEDIYYLRETPAVPLPAGMTNADIDDATPSKAEFLSAITGWAKLKMDAAPAPLYVIMIDHGLEDRFYIYSGSFLDSSRVLTPDQLNNAMSALQNGFTNPAAADQDIVIINGSCNSGSFIEELSGANRLVVTSAKADEKSHRGPKDPADGKRDGELFIRLLFQELGGGARLYDAFTRASEQINEFTLSRANGSDPGAERPQEPLLDDNGDGEGSTAAELNFEFSGAKAEGAESAQDGFDAFPIKLGFGANAGESVGWVTAAQTVTLEAFPEPLPGNVLFAIATDDLSAGDTAWIEVKQPAYTSSTPAGTGNSQSNDPDETLENFQQFVDLAIFDSPTVFPGDGVFNWQGGLVERGGARTLNQVLEDAGTYQVYYFIKDASSNATASHLITSIYRDSDDNTSAPSHVTLTFPADGATTLTTTLLAWTPSVDSPGDLIDYRVEIALDAGFTLGLITVPGVGQPQLTDHFVIVGPDDGIDDDTTYYWRVVPRDQFGLEPAPFGAQVRTFHTDNDNTTLPGFILGHVTDAAIDALIGGVSVVVDGTADDDSGTTPLNGGFSFSVQPGNYTVSFTKVGYAVQAQIVKVESGKVTQLLIALEPDAAGFLWGDVSADAKAGVLDAAFIAQWQALMRTTFPIDPAIVKPLFPDGADVNGDNALGTLDISEILKKVVRIINHFPADTDENGRGPDAKSLGAKTLAKATERLLELPANVTGNPGDVILVPITIDDAAGVLGFTIKVDFDATLLEPLGDQTVRGEVATGFATFLVNDAIDGSIVVVGAGSAPAEGSGTLVMLAFRVRDTAAPSSTAALTFDAESTNLNDGEIPVLGDRVP